MVSCADLSKYVQSFLLKYLSAMIAKTSVQPNAAVCFLHFNWTVR